MGLLHSSRGLFFHPLINSERAASPSSSGFRQEVAEGGSAAVLRTLQMAKRGSSSLSGGPRG